jgi:hypothetical protein
VVEELFEMPNPLNIAGREFGSRLFLGTPNPQRLGNRESRISNSRILDIWAQELDAREGDPKALRTSVPLSERPLRRKMATRIGKAVGGAFEGDAHAYLTSVYKDPSKPENVRIDAAKAAIRYEKPALAPVEQGGPDTDFIPLAKRIEYYTRRDASESSASKVVELKSPTSVDDAACPLDQSVHSAFSRISSLRSGRTRRGP